MAVLSYHYYYSFCYLPCVFTRLKLLVIILCLFLSADSIRLYNDGLFDKTVVGFDEEGGCTRAGDDTDDGEGGILLFVMDGFFGGGVRKDPGLSIDGKSKYFPKTGSSR